MIMQESTSPIQPVAKPAVIVRYVRVTAICPVCGNRRAARLSEEVIAQLDLADALDGWDYRHMRRTISLTCGTGACNIASLHHSTTPLQRRRRRKIRKTR